MVVHWRMPTHAHRTQHETCYYTGERLPSKIPRRWPNGWKRRIRRSKGGPSEEDGEIHWGDETGVRSTCQHSRGYARPGETPELIVPGSRFSVNMISTITNQGKVRWMIYTGKMNAALFIVFLTRLIAGATKKVFLIVDHLSVHEATAVNEWLADKKDRIEVFYLPKYAPERNPDEYLNCDVKANINTDGLPKDREELTGKLRRFMAGFAVFGENQGVTAAMNRLRAAVKQVGNLD